MDAAEQVTNLKAVSGLIRNKVISGVRTSVSPAASPKKAKRNTLILAAELSESTYRKFYVTYFFITNKNLIINLLNSCNKRL